MANRPFVTIIKTFVETQKVQTIVLAWSDEIYLREGSPNVTPNLIEDIKQLLVVISENLSELEQLKGELEHLNNLRVVQRPVSIWNTCFNLGKRAEQLKNNLLHNFNAIKVKVEPIVERAKRRRIEDAAFTVVEKQDTAEIASGDRAAHMRHSMRSRWEPHSQTALASTEVGAQQANGTTTTMKPRSDQVVTDPIEALDEYLAETQALSP